jgi:hypothetical protein
MGDYKFGSDLAVDDTMADVEKLGQNTPVVMARFLVVAFAATPTDLFILWPKLKVSR